MLLCRPLRGLADLFAALPQVPLRSTWGYIYFAAPQLRIVLTQPLTCGLLHRWLTPPGRKFFRSFA